VGRLKPFAKRLPVALGFVGVGVGEGVDGIVKTARVAEIRGEGDGVSGASVAAGEEFAANIGVSLKASSGEAGEVEAGFVVVQLADKIVAGLTVGVGDGGVTEERVRGELHGALAVDDAMALVGMRVAVRKIERVGGARLFFDLQKQRVENTGGGRFGWRGMVRAFKVDAVIARADGAGADDFEADVDGAVLVEKMSALGLERECIRDERGEDLLGFGSRDATEQWRNVAEVALA